MKYTIVLRKIGKGALIGGIAALVAIRPDDLQKGGIAVATAVLAGLISGGLNAWKHRDGDTEENQPTK